jgi:hypothetical protein
MQKGLTAMYLFSYCPYIHSKAIDLLLYLFPLFPLYRWAANHDG